MQIFFSLIFVRIHTKIVIQIVYCEFVHGVVFVPIHNFFFVRIHTKIVIQIVYCEFVHGVVFVPIHTFFNTNCIVRIHTTSRERAASCEGDARAARATPEPRGRRPSREGEARAHLLPRPSIGRKPDQGFYVLTRSLK
jgi:hypothetical protein